MGDSNSEIFELDEAATADSQQPLTNGKEQDDSDGKLPPKKDRKKDIRAFWLAVFNLMNAILGSGVLGLADAMKNLGVIVFYILLLLTALLTIYTIYLLLVASKASGVQTYEDLSKKAFGRAGKIATSIMIVFHCFGSICSYMHIAKNELPEIMKVFINNNNATMTVEHSSTDGPWYMQGTILLIILVATVIAPLCTMREIKFLGYTSAFGMLCMFVFTLVVIAKKFSIPCPLKNHTDYGDLNHTIEGEQTCKADFAIITSKTAYAVPTMLFAFMCHASVHPIYRELRRTSVKKMKKVAAVSVFSVFVVYLLSASFGYFTFYNYILSELLLTYSLHDPSDAIIVATRFMVLICVTLSAPVLHYSCRETIVVTFLPPRIRNNEKLYWPIHLGVMLTILSTAVILVIAIPDIRNIFGLSGATASTTLLVIFPCFFYLRVVKRKKDDRFQRIAIMALLVLGIIFMIISLSLIIMDMIK